MSSISENFTGMSSDNIYDAKNNYSKPWYSFS
jgi:hypothetical protein